MVECAEFIDDLEIFKREKPYYLSYFDEENLPIPKSNFSWSVKPLNLTDLRTLPKSEWPTMEKHRCCFTEQHLKELGNDTNERNAQALSEEVGDWLKEFLGAKTVIPWITRFRSANKEHNKAPPATDAHSDFVPQEAWRNMMNFLSQEERDSLLSGKTRARIVNVWRPLYYPAEDYPLAILDPYTVDPAKDLITVDKVNPMGVVASHEIQYSPNHRWYWLSNQTPEEVILFTQFDTHSPEGLFSHIGHCSFRNTNARPGCPPRQSVETRYIVLSPASYEGKKDFLESVDTRVRPWQAHLQVPPPVFSPPKDPNNRPVITGPPPRPETSTAVKVQ